MALVDNNLTRLCENIRMYMSDVQGINYGFNMGPELGALDYITSPFNRNGVEILPLSTPNGKIRSARIIYDQRSNWGEAVTGAAAEAVGLCDTATEPASKEVTKTIDNKVAMNQPIEFSNSKLQQYCDNPEQFMNEQFLNKIKGTREALNRAILSDLLAGIGKNNRHDGTTISAGGFASEQILSAGTAQAYVPDYSNFYDVKLDYENNQFNGVPGVIGDGNLSKFYGLAQYATANSDIPFESAIATSGMAFFKDQLASGVLGANNSVVIAPGAVQFLTFNENADININDDSVKHITIPDPMVPGLMWDVDFKWDECNKKYIWFASVWFDTFVTFQDDSFSDTMSPADDLDGVTGIFGYTFTAE